MGAVNLDTESEDNRLNDLGTDIKTLSRNEKGASVRSTQIMRYELKDIGQGDFPMNALYALTGQRATTIPASNLSDQNSAFNQLSQAQKEGRPMILNTNGMKDMPHDGLVKGDWNKDPAKSSGHAYIVKSVSKDANGDVVLTLVNPWGNNHNSDQVEAKDVPDPSSPVVQVKLKDITATGHLGDIEIGAAPPAAPKS